MDNRRGGEGMGLSLEAMAAKLSGVEWKLPDRKSFTAQCPFDPAHVFGVSRLIQACRSGCSNEKIQKFFANGTTNGRQQDSLHQPSGEGAGRTPDDPREVNGHRPGAGHSASASNSNGNGYHPPARLSSADDILRRVPPQNLEAEQSVLGAILLENEAIEEANRILKPEDFYRESHRIIFGAMQSLWRSKIAIDVKILGAELSKKQGQFENVGGYAYLTELAAEVPTAQNIAHYAAIVHAKAISRRLAAAATNIASLAYEGVTTEALLGEAARVFAPIVESGVEKNTDPILATIDTALIETVTAGALSFGTASNFLEGFRSERGKSTVLCEGLLRTRNLSLLVGRAWAGKTTIAANMARSLVLGEPFLGRPCKSGTRVAYLALERNGSEVADLFEQWGIADQVLFLDRVPIGDPREMARALAYEIHRTQVEITIIDHLVGMIHLEDGNDYVSVSRALAPFNAIAKYTSSHIFLLHHQPKTAGLGNEINVMGSEAFRAATDCLLEASKIGQNYFFRAQSRGIPDTERLRITRNDSGLLESEPGVDGVKAEIMSVLAAAEAPLTSKGIMELSPELKSIPAKNVMMALKRLAEENQILREGKGKPRAPFYYSIGQRTQDDLFKAGDGNSGNNDEASRDDTTTGGRSDWQDR